MTMSELKRGARMAYRILLDSDGRFADVILPLPVTLKDLQRLERWTQKFVELIQIEAEENRDIANKIRREFSKCDHGIEHGQPCSECPGNLSGFQLRSGLEEHSG